jgi:hypothetical protein
MSEAQKTVTFIIRKGENSIMEGCKFVNGMFKTSNPKKIKSLRNSHWYGKGFDEVEIHTPAQKKPIKPQPVKIDIPGDGQPNLTSKPTKPAAPPLPKAKPVAKPKPKPQK